MPPPDSPVLFPIPVVAAAAASDSEADVVTLPLAAPAGLPTTRHAEQSLLEGLPLIIGPALAGQSTVPSLGEVIGDMYEVVGTLGNGAMGVVLLAVDQRLGRKVAIKLIQSTLLAGHFRELFLREARAMAEVNHPNVLSIHALGQHGDVPYFVMEFVEGTTLNRVIAQQGAAIDIDLALGILREICAGVQAMHEAKTVHRDLKPANILLDAGLHVRVADLGLAQKYLGTDAVREFVGTPGYIAPELAAARAVLATPRSDVYSLGCIAYELLTGKAPLKAASSADLIALHATQAITPPSSVRPNLPTALDAILLKALAKEPEQRTASAAELYQELRAARRKSLDPARILVADDDADFRSVLETKLRAEFPDTDIECVHDGRAALEAFERKPASMVILDLKMPGLDGVGVTVCLRARPASAKVPILVVTGLGGPSEWQVLSKLGVERLLVKPVDLDDVVTIVRRASKRSREALATAQPGGEPREPVERPAPDCDTPS